MEEPTISATVTIEEAQARLPKKLGAWLAFYVANAKTMPNHGEPNRWRYPIAECGLINVHTPEAPIRHWMPPVLLGEAKNCYTD